MSGMLGPSRTTFAKILLLEFASITWVQPPLAVGPCGFGLRLSIQPGRRSLHLDLRRPAGGLLVKTPSAQGDGRVGLRGRHLALAVDAELLGHGAAEDPVDNGRLDVRVATAAELLELRGVEALIHLVDAATLTEEVHDPEGVIHDLAPH